MFERSYAIREARIIAIREDHPALCARCKAGNLGPCDVAVLLDELEQVAAAAWDEGFQARTLMAYGVAGPQRNPHLAAERPEGSELEAARRAHGMDPETRARTNELVKGIELPTGRRASDPGLEELGC